MCWPASGAESRTRARGPGQGDRRGLELDLAEDRVRDRPGHAEMADLLVLVDLLDVQDGAGGDALGVEQLHPLRRWFAPPSRSPARR